MKRRAFVVYCSQKQLYTVGYTPLGLLYFVYCTLFVTCYLQSRSRNFLRSLLREFYASHMKYLQQLLICSVLRLGFSKQPVKTRATTQLENCSAGWTSWGVSSNSAAPIFNI